VYHVCRFNSIRIGGFIFADQFLQISALLPANNIYGIGEHKTNLKLNTNWQSFTLFNKDQSPRENVNSIVCMHFQTQYMLIKIQIKIFYLFN